MYMFSILVTLLTRFSYYCKFLIQYYYRTIFRDNKRSIKKKYIAALENLT